jgi:hypothetical protein
MTLTEKVNGAAEKVAENASIKLIQRFFVLIGIPIVLYLAAKSLDVAIDLKVDFAKVRSTQVDTLLPGYHALSKNLVDVPRISADEVREIEREIQSQIQKMREKQFRHEADFDRHRIER